MGKQVDIEQYVTQQIAHGIPSFQVHFICRTLRRNAESESPRTTGGGFLCAHSGGDGCWSTWRT